MTLNLAIFFLFMWCFTGGQMAYYLFERLLDKGKTQKAYLVLLVAGPFIWLVAITAIIIQLIQPKPAPKSPLEKAAEYCADCPHRQISHLWGKEECTIPGCPCKAFKEKKP